MRGRGRWLVLLLALLPAGVGAQQPGDSARQGRGREFVEDFAWGVRGTVHVLEAPARWGRGEWAAVPALGIALASLSGADEPVQRAVDRNRTGTADRAARRIEPLGAQYSIGLVVATYGAGLAAEQPALRRTGVEAATSSVVAAGIVTPLLKRLVGRTRPWGGRGAFDFHSLSGNESFPSGHTTQAFAAASVFAAEARPLWAKAGIYGLAGSVAAARMVHDAHFLSDIVAAGIIGTVTGRAVVHWRRGQAGAGLAPYVGGDGLGVELRF